MTIQRAVKKALFAAFLGGLFLVPFFSWIAAGPVPYHDGEGFFSIVPPEGWKTDDSGHMGPGVVIKGPAGPSGIEPVVHLLHQPSGIVTLDVQWLTRLGQIRFDLESVRFLSLEDHETADPPYYQARYSYMEKSLPYHALVRLVKHDDHFYFMTAAAPEGEFEEHLPLLQNVLESFRPGGGD